MKVSIVVPGPAWGPVGGIRVHYEYANRLAARGHSVTVVAQVATGKERLKCRCRGVERSIRGSGWFRFDPRVGFAISSGRSLPRCDVAIVTGWQTAERARDYRRRARAVVQVAYDYEFWKTASLDMRERMAAAFACPDAIVGTSSAVASMVREAGRDVVAVIPCGLDVDTFRIVKSPASRPAAVGFIGRADPAKRAQDAIDALAEVRRDRPVRIVAVKPGSIELPPWVEIVDAPDDDAMRGFYNSVAVFVVASEYEGWGLPVAEAMACGAAVVTTRSGGVEDFAADGVNALLVPPRSPGLLAEACERVLEDDSMRLRLVEAGVRTAQGMDWNAAVDALEGVLRSVGSG